jgi:hypothetical protein
VGGKNFRAKKKLKKPKTLGKGGCVFGSSPKWFERLHPQLVHWWLLVNSVYLSMVIKNLKIDFDI